jgi:hypothetical protein
MSAPEDETVLDVAPGAAGLGLREAETLMRSVPTADPLQVDTRDVTRLHLGIVRQSNRRPAVQKRETAGLLGWQNHPIFPDEIQKAYASRWVRRT